MFYFGITGILFLVAGRELRGIKGKDALKAFVRAGGVVKGGKGDHINIKMPNGQLATLPGKGELKIGLLKALLKKVGLSPERFMELL